MFKFKYRYYLILFLALISVFLFSCSDTQPSKNQQDTTQTTVVATKTNPATSSLSIQSTLRLSHQIQFLTNKTEIIKISDTKSMVPTLDSNSLAIIEKITIFETLKVGDIIVYKNNEINSPVFGEYIIHRIYEIDNKNQKLRTKGDNNLILDSQIIDLNNILGRVFCVIYSSEEIK